MLLSCYGELVPGPSHRTFSSLRELNDLGDQNSGGGKEDHAVYAWTDEGKV